MSPPGSAADHASHARRSSPTVWATCLLVLNEVSQARPDVNLDVGTIWFCCRCLGYRTTLCMSRSHSQCKHGWIEVGCTISSARDCYRSVWREVAEFWPSRYGWACHPGLETSIIMCIYHTTHAFNVASMMTRDVSQSILLLRGGCSKV